MNVLTVEELREMMICVCDRVAAEERRQIGRAHV